MTTGTERRRRRVGGYGSRNTFPDCDEDDEDDAESASSLASSSVSDTAGRGSRCAEPCAGRLAGEGGKENDCCGKGDVGVDAGGLRRGEEESVTSRAVR